MISIVVVITIISTTLLVLTCIGLSTLIRWVAECANYHRGICVKCKKMRYECDWNFPEYRVYSCPNCYHQIMVTFKSVDKNYKRDFKRGFIGE